MKILSALQIKVFVEQAPNTPKVPYFDVLQWRMTLHCNFHGTLKSGSKSVSTQ